MPHSTFGIFTVEIDRHKEILARHGAVAAGDIAAISVSRLIDCVDTPGFLARLGPESVVLAINMDTDRFGENIYNLYGSTEVAFASIATPSGCRRPLASTSNLPELTPSTRPAPSSATITPPPGAIATP